MASTSKKNDSNSDDDDDDYLTDEESRRKRSASGQETGTVKIKKKKSSSTGRLSSVSDRTMSTLAECHPGVFTKISVSKNTLIPKTNAKPAVQVLCTVCNCRINIASGTKDADNHVKTVKHVIAVKAAKGQLSLFNSGVVRERERSENKVLDGEILISQWIAASNIAFVTSPELIKICKTVFSDSKIARSITCGATKCTMMAKTVGASYVTRVVELLQQTPFTLMIDESNDNGADKVLAILARTCMGEPCTSFVALLECRCGTADHIFTLIDSFYREHSIPWGNCVAFESDNCSVMKGRHKGVIALIRKKNPLVVDLGCVAHLVNLCNVKALKSLSLQADDLVVDIDNHFTKSTLRTTALEGYFDDFPGLEYTNFLKHCPTRWLSLKPCIKRLLDYWEPMCLYFRDQSDVGRVKAIKKLLSDPSTKAILLFLDDILRNVNSYNMLFQKEAFILDQAYEATVSLAKEVLGRILVPSHIREHIRDDISQMSFDSDNLLPDSDVDKGDLCAIYLADIEDGTLPCVERKVAEAVRSFTSNFFLKMRDSLPWELLSQLSVLNPKGLSTLTTAKFIELADNLGVVSTTEDRNAIRKDLRSLLCDSRVMECATKAKDAPSLWLQLSAEYPSLKPAISHIFSLPNSNAHTERVFSMMKAVHTPVRNSLSLETINSILSIKVNKTTAFTSLDIGDKTKRDCKKATQSYNEAHVSTSVSDD